MAPPVITLLTDFGSTDPFVGVMKGVIIGRAPGSPLIDLTHGIPAQDVGAAAFWLGRAYPWFPAGTVHLAVVDPGVGTARRPIAASHGGHYFVVPDNGLLPEEVASKGECVELDLGALGVTRPSATFHGRDVFAPAAAALARGVPLAELGRRALDLVPSAMPVAWDAGPRAEGVIAVVDHFGTLISNVEPRDRDLRAVTVGGKPVPVARTYADVARGELVALVGSFGTVEVAVREGSARARLELGPGTDLVVLFS